VVGQHALRPSHSQGCGRGCGWSGHRGRQAEPAAAGACGRLELDFEQAAAHSGPGEAVEASDGSLKAAEVDHHLTNSQFTLRFRLGLSMVEMCLRMGCLWTPKAGYRGPQAKSVPRVAPGKGRAGPSGITEVSYGEQDD